MVLIARGLRRFAIHDRALIVFRVLVGLLSLDALLLDWRHLEALIGHEGIFPNELARQGAVSPLFPLYFWVDAGAGLHLLYALHLVVAVGFTFGFLLRYTAPALWFLTLCFQCRAEVWLTGFHEYQRLLLFWSLFLPLTSAKWDKPKIVASPASAAILMQIVLVYVMSGLLKTGPEWRWPGSAIGVVLSLEPLRLPFGDWLRNFPRLLQIGSAIVPWLEVLGGAFLFSNRRTVRHMAMVALTLLHVGIGLSFFTGQFPWICVAALTLFWRPVTDPVEFSLGRWRYFPLAALTGIALWNLAFLGGHADLRAKWRRPLYWLRLDQYWYTFSPSPAKQSIWLTASGMCRTGTRRWLDRRNEQTEDGRKVLPPSLVRSVHWIEYTYRLPRTGEEPLRVALGQYLCRRSKLTLSEARVLKLELVLKDETTGMTDYFDWMHDCKAPEPR